MCSSIAREDRFSENKIAMNIIGFSDVISPVGYPWISPGEAHRLSLDVISPDVFYARNS